jgi:hypothetical protein
LDRRLGGPQSRSGRGGEEKNSQPIIRGVKRQAIRKFKVEEERKKA